MPRTRTPKLISVERGAIPSFASHDEATELRSEMRPDFDSDVPSPEAVRAAIFQPRAHDGRALPVQIRVDADVLRRLRVLAARKGTGYQTLLKIFVVERLYEEEKREGLI